MLNLSFADLCQILYPIFIGESVLHMAIVNEDPAMVKYLLDRDEWELHKCRCVGFFFSAFDQSDARSDVQGSELIQLNTAKTNYKGTTGCLV